MEKKNKKKSRISILSSFDLTFETMSTRMPLQVISNTMPMVYPSYQEYYYDENQIGWMDTTSPSMDFCDYSYSNDSSAFPVQTKKKSTRQSRHIPHHLRPQHLVELRNTRERRRVHDVNQAFQTLQTLLPLDPSSNDSQDQWNLKPASSRLSKVQTLRTAVDYIEALQRMLDENYWRAFVNFLF